MDWGMLSCLLHVALFLFQCLYLSSKIQLQGVLGTDISSPLNLPEARLPFCRFFSAATKITKTAAKRILFVPTGLLHFQLCWDSYFITVTNYSYYSYFIELLLEKSNQIFIIISVICDVQIFWLRRGTPRFAPSGQISPLWL